MVGRRSTVARGTCVTVIRLLTRVRCNVRVKYVKLHKRERKRRIIVMRRRARPSRIVTADAEQNGSRLSKQLKPIVKNAREFLRAGADRKRKGRDHDGRPL